MTLWFSDVAQETVEEMSSTHSFQLIHTVNHVEIHQVLFQLTSDEIMQSGKKYWARELIPHTHLAPTVHTHARTQKFPRRNFITLIRKNDNVFPRRPWREVKVCD